MKSLHLYNVYTEVIHLGKLHRWLLDSLQFLTVNLFLQARAELLKFKDEGLKKNLCYCCFQSGTLSVPNYQDLWSESQTMDENHGVHYSGKVKEILVYWCRLLDRQNDQFVKFITVLWKVMKDFFSALFSFLCNDRVLVGGA